MKKLVYLCPCCEVCRLASRYTLMATSSPKTNIDDMGEGGELGGDDDDDGSLSGGWGDLGGFEDGGDL